MPGILPMKVIKVGTSTQARIAQACDRCRSKKIRCDGMRPCCTQCANVGFECKTSDKLSRRAFPRGYTESLEERVRGLESEIRELKDLLDEKDEKIDMLSRIHSQTPHSIQVPSPRRQSSAPDDGGAHHQADTPDKDEVFKVQQTPCLLAGPGDGADSYFTGTSSARMFIEAFKHKAQECGRSTGDINSELLLASRRRDIPDAPLSPPSPAAFKAPPRLVSDQLVNIFFQEWAPLFPVLHRPTFLSLYEKYVADADVVTDKTAIAQLNLVFGIAALSNGARSSADLDGFETQWKAAIDKILTENSLATLQALILAQIYCVQQGDLTRLLTYKGLSTSLSARLGLHQSQKRFALGTLTCETRKKVFWTLYTVDSFTAIILGLPKHLKDDDVHCEYPVDADDEYVTERGFQPTLPGESTKLSSALAFFRAARILSKVLEEIYPARASFELSTKTLSQLSEELDAWSNSLAPHLRLQFVQDKPSTGTISSRSPLLSLTYHWIRVLIHRPAVCASLGNTTSSSSMIMLASSCKHIIQIIQLLEERSMRFSFCLNKDELLVLSGFGLLFQGLGLDPSSKILKDNQKMTAAVIGLLDRSKAPCTPEFHRIAQSFLPRPPTRASPAASSATLAAKGKPAISRHNSDPTLSPSPAASTSPPSTRKQLKAIACRLTGHSSNTSTTSPESNEHRRATMPNIALHPYGIHSQSQPSLPSAAGYSPASISQSEPATSPVNTLKRTPSLAVRPSAPPHSSPQSSLTPKARLPPPNPPNLDYLSFSSEPENGRDGHASQLVKTEPHLTDWERLLGSLDNGTTNIYDACYGGPPVEALIESPALTVHANYSATAVDNTTTDGATEWSSDIWAPCQVDGCTSPSSGITASHEPADSILSFSTDDAKSSAGDFVNSEWISSGSATVGNDLYRGIVMPAEFGHSDDLNFASSLETVTIL